MSAEDSYTEEDEARSDASMDLLMLHKPRVEMDINNTLIDCDPRLNTCSYEEFQEAVEACLMWTIVSADDGLTYAEPGNHIVNAMSHHICEIPYKLQMLCPNCGGSSITKDATAEWDEDNQEWGMAGICDSGWCQDCDTEVRYAEERVVIPA